MNVDAKGHTLAVGDVVLWDADPMRILYLDRGSMIAEPFGATNLMDQTVGLNGRDVEFLDHCKPVAGPQLPPKAADLLELGLQLTRLMYAMDNAAAGAEEWLNRQGADTDTLNRASEEIANALRRIWETVGFAIEDGLHPAAADAAIEPAAE